MSRNFLSLFVTALVVCSFALMPVAAQANTITGLVANGGFESPGYYTTFAAGDQEWRTDSAYGAYILDQAAWNLGFAPHSGTYMACPTDSGDSSQSPGGGYQQLMVGGSAFQFGAGDIDGVLTVSIWGFGRYGAGSEHFNLYSGATWAERTLVATSPDYSQGQPWTQAIWTYTTAGAPTGVNLWLELYKVSGNQLYWDDVEASYEYIPEPGTLALLATGLIGLLCYAWRKRR